MGKELTNVHQKWAYIMDQIGYIKKDEKVEFASTKYTAVTEGKVLSKIRPLMVELNLIMYPTNGIIKYVQPSTKGTQLVTTLEVTYNLLDADSGTAMTLWSAGQGADTQDKGSSKAMTNAGKYAILKGLMIETGDDPDYQASAELDAKTDFVDDDPDDNFDVLFQEVQAILEKAHNDNVLTDVEYKGYIRGLDEISIDQDWTRLKAARKILGNL